jgi:hypothetical protein
VNDRHAPEVGARIAAVATPSVPSLYAGPGGMLSLR